MRDYAQILNPVEPPIWIGNSHMHTLASYYLPAPRPRSKPKKIFLRLQDRVPQAQGDQILLEVFQGTTTQVIYLFHGLGGDSSSKYMQAAVVELHEKDHHTVILVNHRGQGEGRQLARGLYFSGSYPDAAEVVGWGRREFPQSRHIVIGYSLSGNMALLLAGHAQNLPKEQRPDRILSVNPPVNPRASSLLLKKGFNRIYDLSFVREFRRRIASRHQLIDAPPPFVPPLASVWDIDEIYTAKAVGFKNRDEMYSACTSTKIFDQIEIPTSILIAQDDPFIDPSDHLSAPRSSQVRIHMENHGGHLGYLTRQGWGYRRWLENAIACILKND